uniref:Uncharacterized protein n=1 Tax=Arundo donax TaxID=35708 RepID=A0A0A8XS78_ARUDO
MEASCKLKKDVAKGIKVSNITGCPLFLQVLVIDSADLGTLNMDHNVLPRIKCFTQDRLKSMVSALSCSTDGGNHDAGFKVPKLRPAREVVYSWGTDGLSPDLKLEGFRALWQQALKMTSFLKVQAEVDLCRMFHSFNELHPHTDILLLLQRPYV